MAKAVIFDRDGVLIDSEYTNIRAGELAFADFNVTLTEEEKKKIVGYHVDDYSRPMLEKYGIPYDKFRPLQSKHYYELLEATPIFEHTVEFLKAIHTRKIPVALCTSGSRQATLKLLDRLGIHDLFQAIVTNEDYSKKKPDPEPYLVTAKRLGFAPHECLVIEDSEVGLKAALRAGMKCIVIFNNYTADHDFSGAKKIVGSASELDLDELLH